MQYTIACVSHLYANPKVISILNLWNHELDPRFNLREVRTKISSTDCIRGAVDWLGVKMSAMCSGCSWPHWILTLLQLSTNRTISGFRKSTIATSFWGEMSRRKNPLRSLGYKVSMVTDNLQHCRGLLLRNGLVILDLQKMFQLTSYPHL